MNQHRVSAVGRKRPTAIIQLSKNYVNLKHCIDQKFNVIVIKTAKRRSNLLKTLVSQEIFTNIGLRKKSVLKFPEFWIKIMLF